MIPVLVYVRPLDKTTGARVDIYVGSAADATALGLNATNWEPAISRRPRIAQDLRSPELDGRFKLATADVEIAMGMTSIARPERFYWPGAPIFIYRVDQLDWSLRTIEFQGIVRTGPYDLDSKKVTLNCMVDRTLVEKPLLTAEFTGGGGILGDAAKRGVLKPAGFGVCESIEWVVFDETYHIGMLDGYGNLVSVQACLEGLSDMGASVGDYVDYTALKNAIIAKTIPPGRWGTCIAQGLVGLGAPPAGRITFHATFGTTRPGALMKRWLTVHAGVAVGSIDTASFDALDIAVPRDVRMHFTSQATVDDLIEQMCLGCNATPLITVQSLVAVTRGTVGASIATLNRNRAETPRVTGWRVADPIDPVYKIVMRGARPGVVLEDSEVNYEDDLIDRGLWDVTVTYRLGNLVWKADGSQWLYTFATATTGNPLPASTVLSNTWWSRKKPAQVGSDIGVADGATADLTFDATTYATAVNTVIGNNVQMGQDPAAAHNNMLVSNQGILEGFTLEWEVPAQSQGHHMVGVVDNAAIPGSGSRLLMPYAFLLYNVGSGLALNASETVAGVRTEYACGTYAVGDKLRIVGDGVNVRYYKNNALVRTVARADNGTLFRMAITVRYTPDGAKNIAFYPSNRANFNAVGGATRPSDNATADIKLNLSGSGLTIVGNSFSVPVAQAAWAGAVYSAESYVEGFTLEATYVAAAAPPSDDLIGVGLQGSSLASSAGFLYSLNPFNTWQVSEAGVSTGTGAPSASGDRIRIVGDGVNVRYYINNTLVKTTARTDAGAAFRAQAMSFKAGAGYSAIAFQPSARLNFNVVGGATRPSDNAGTTLAISTVSGPAGVNIIGNTIDVAAPSASLDQLVASQNSFPRAAYLEAKIEAGLRVNFGLSQDRTTYLVGTHWIGGVFVAAGGNISAYDAAGVLIAGSTTAVDPTAIYAIDCDGVISTFLKNGIFYASCPVTAGLTFFAKALFGSSAGGKMTGVRFEKGNSRAWSDEGGVGRPSDNAGTTVTLAIVNSAFTASISIIGNTVAQTGAALSYNYAVVGQALYGACFCEVDINNGWSMVALDDDTTSTDYTQQQAIAFYNKTNGSVQLYYGAVQQAVATIATGLSGKLAIVCDGVNIRVFVAGVQRFTLAAPAALIGSAAIYPKFYPYEITQRYTGLLAGYYSDNQWASVGGPNRPSDNAGTTLQMVKLGAGTINIQGNSLIRSDAGGTWNTNAVSKEFFVGAAFVMSRLPTINTFIGLTDSNVIAGGNASQSYFEVDYGFHRSSNGNWYIYESGTLALTLGTAAFGVTFTSSTIFSVVYDGVNVRYYADGVLMRTVASAASRTFYASTSHFAAGAQVTDIVFGPFADRFMDNIGDGTIYGKLKLIELTGGELKLATPGSGRKLGDIRNLPNVSGFGLSYKFTGTITYTAAAGTPATATISVTAGSTIGGSVSVSYNAMSVGVSGTAGTFITYYLYVDDPTNAGGTQTLIATTTPLTVFQADGRVYIGTCDVLYPVSGTGGGGGSGGGGGCVDVEMFIPDAAVERAGDLRGGFRILGLDYVTMAGDHYINIDSVDFSWEECVELESASGIVAVASISTPCTIRQGCPIPIMDCLGHCLPVRDHAGFRWEEIVRLDRVGVRRVAHVHAQGGTYAAGRDRGRYIYLHNPNPKP